MKSSAIRSVRVRGLTSIADLRLELVTPVTVLIGANGSGKSNIVATFDLLGRILDRQLHEYVVRRGGFASLLHRSSVPEQSARQVELQVSTEPASGFWVEGYSAIIDEAGNDEAAIRETFVQVNPVDGSSTDPVALPLSRESRVPDILARDLSADFDPLLGVLRGLSSCRVFHFQDMSRDAPVKERVDEADNLSLAPDARNIAPLLARLRSDHPVAYDRIVRSVRAVAPFFDDFVLEHEFDRLRLRWRENGIGGAFSANELSDGTLRFICLAVLFQQPDRPSTIVLDEPELGLHPFAIHQLVALVRAATREGGKVVLATQSEILLSYFDVGEIAVIERSLRGTYVTRPDAESLAGWLEEYSLGELWEKNVLGGRPRPDAAVPPWDVPAS